MRKWGFLGLMFGLSLLNGGFFVRDTLRLMGEGIAGVDNQASLLFIPIFWIIAAAVLLVIYAWALIYGIRIERRYRFRAAQLVCLSELSRRELVGRGAFFAVTGLLMWAALELSVEYALSGGGLLACHMGGKQQDLAGLLYFTAGVMMGMAFFDLLPGTVRSRLSDTRKHLRAALKRQKG